MSCHYKNNQLDLNRYSKIHKSDLSQNEKVTKYRKGSEANKQTKAGGDFRGADSDSPTLGTHVQ